MAVKVSLYRKFNVTRSTVYVKSFILVSKSAHKASFLALCRSTKPHNRIGGMASTMLSIPSSWGSTFGTTSFYYMTQSLRGISPHTQSLLVSKRGVVIMLLAVVAFKTNK